MPASTSTHTQPDADDLHIHSSQREAVAWRGPLTGQRFTLVGDSYWMPAGMARPSDLEAAQRAAATPEDSTA